MGFTSSEMMGAASTSSEKIGAAALVSQSAGVIGQTVGSYRKSQGEKVAYEYQSKIASNNAQIAEWQAQDATTRGAKAQNNLQLKTAQMKGTQQAVMAARGLDLAEGSPLNILSDTEFMGKRDEQTIQSNAAKEAWSLRVQAQNYSANSELYSNRAKSISPFSDAASTLLTGGGRVAASWYSRNKPVSTSSLDY